MSIKFEIPSNVDNFTTTDLTVAGSFTLDGYVINPSSAVTNQVLRYNGSAFVPGDVSGIGGNIGASITGSTPKSILFINASSQLAQDNTNLYYDYSTLQLQTYAIGSISGSDPLRLGTLTANAVNIGHSGITTTIDGYFVANNQATFNSHIIIDGYTIDLSSGATNGQVLKYNGTKFTAGVDDSGTISGSIATNQIAYGSGTNTITGSSGLTYNGSVFKSTGLIQADGGIDRSTSGTLNIAATNATTVNVSNIGATTSISGNTITLFANTAPSLLFSKVGGNLEASSDGYRVFNTDGYGNTTFGSTSGDTNLQGVDIIQSASTLFQIYTSSILAFSTNGSQTVIGDASNGTTFVRSGGSIQLEPLNNINSVGISTTGTTLEYKGTNGTPGTSLSFLGGNSISGDNGGGAISITGGSATGTAYGGAITIDAGGGGMGYGNVNIATTSGAISIGNQSTPMTMNTAAVYLTAGYDHAFLVLTEGPDTNGHYLALVGGHGGVASATAGGIGGQLISQAGQGGDGILTKPAGDGGVGIFRGGLGGANLGGGGGFGGLAGLYGGQGSDGYSSSVGKRGGAVEIFGGLGGAGTASAAAGPGADVIIRGGQAGTNNGGGGADSGNIYVDAGISSGAGIHGDAYLGTTYADAVHISRSGKNTIVNGPLESGGPFTASSNVTLGSAPGNVLYFYATAVTSLRFGQGGAPNIGQQDAELDSNSNQFQIFAGNGGDAYATAGGLGGKMVVYAGLGGNGTASLVAGKGGDAWLIAGNAGTNNGGGGNDGGNIVIRAGDPTGSGTKGYIQLDGYVSVDGYGYLSHDIGNADTLRLTQATNTTTGSDLRLRALRFFDDGSPTSALTHKIYAPDGNSIGVSATNFALNVSTVYSAPQPVTWSTGANSLNIASSSSFFKISNGASGGDDAALDGYSILQGADATLRHAMRIAMESNTSAGSAGITANALRVTAKDNTSIDGYLVGINIDVSDGYGTNKQRITQRSKAHAAFSGSSYNETTAAVQTTDATQTIVWSYTLLDTTDYWVEATILGRDPSGSGRALFTLKALVYREGGSATLQNSTQSIHSPIRTNGGITADIIVSSNDVRVVVSGLAATTFNWVATIKYQAVSGNT